MQLQTLKGCARQALGLLLLGVFGCNQALALNFSGALSLETGEAPGVVIQADFDGVKGLDLAVVNRDENTLSIFLNRGDGSYADRIDYVTGSAPFGLTSADFDGLNGPDLAVVNLLSDTLSIFFNQGDGTFAAKTDYPAENGPHSIVSADFDGVSGPDLAVANNGSDNLSIFLNNGDGSYAARVNYTAGDRPNSVVSGDIDGLNGPDLAVANRGSDNVSVFFNNGNGTYAAKVDYPVGEEPTALAIDDFDGVSGPDLAVVNFESDTVSVLLNNSSGSFPGRVDYATTGNPFGLTSGDFDGLNGSDLAVSAQNGLLVMLNNGDGSFAAPVDYPTGGVSHAVTTADLDNQDGLDLALTNISLDTLLVFFNRGDGSFRSSPGYTGGSAGASSVAADDLDGINGPDLAVTNIDGVQIFFNNGDGSYAGGIHYSAGALVDKITIGDFDGINGPDLAVVKWNDNEISVFLNNGDGSYASEVDYPTGTRPDGIVNADFDGINGPDLAVTNRFSNNVSVYLNNGDGSYAASIDYPSGSNPRSLITADLDGVNGPDLAVTNAFSGSVSIFLNNGDGTFSNRIDHPSGAAPEAIAVADFDGIDGLDLAVANIGSYNLALFFNNGDGSFSPGTTYPTGRFPGSVAVGDFDGINGTDLAVTNAGPGGPDNVSIFLNDGNGSFDARVNYYSGRIPGSVIDGDFDGFNGTDLALTSSDGFGQVSILFNITSSSLDDFIFIDQAGVDLNTLTTSNTVTVAGLTGSAEITVVGGEYKINNGGFVSSSGLVSNGDTVTLRQTSSSNHATRTETLLTIGEISDIFSVTTLADTMPETFSFTDQTDVELETQVTSNQVNIDELGAPAVIAVSGGEYQINSGEFFTQSGFVNAGDSVTVRQTSSSNHDTQSDTVLSVGGISDTFSVTTLVDTLPDAFSFTDQTGVALNTLISSNSVNISGLGAAAEISVSGGEYRINGGDFTASVGVVDNGDIVVLRQTSSSNHDTQTDTVLTVGGASDTFSVTTLVDTLPDAFSFTDQTGVALNTLISSDSVNLSGFGAAVEISVSGGEYRINGGDFTASVGFVDSGDTVVLRQTSSAGYLTRTDTVLTVGGVSDTFSLTTMDFDRIGTVSSVFKAVKKLQKNKAIKKHGKSKKFIKKARKHLAKAIGFLNTDDQVNAAAEINRAIADLKKVTKKKSNVKKQIKKLTAIP